MHSCSYARISADTYFRYLCNSLNHMVIHVPSTHLRNLYSLCHVLLISLCYSEDGNVVEASTKSIDSPHTLWIGERVHATTIEHTRTITSSHDRRTILSHEYVPYAGPSDSDAMRVAKICVQVCALVLCVYACVFCVSVYARHI